MSDDIWKRDEVESPCINICVVHPAARICTGCYRSIDEIAHWSRLSPDARRAVLSELNVIRFDNGVMTHSYDLIIFYNNRSYRHFIFNI